MSYITCSKCNGTGKEICDVHGSHPCSACNGKGCIKRECGIIWASDNTKCDYYD